MFRFESPHFLWTLLILPTFWFLFVYLDRKKEQQLSHYFSVKNKAFLRPSLSLKRRFFKKILLLFSLTLWIFALARPQYGKSSQKVVSQGVEIFFLVDVSESMLAEDAKPNRLEQAKAELSRLVDLMPGHKMGVIAFAGSASVLSPLTNDPQAVKMYVESLSPYSVSTQGTSFQGALEAAGAAFERGGVTADGSSHVTKVMLVVSDGEDQEPGALDFAKKLTEKGIRIFGLAFGTEKGAGIPVRDGMGYLKGYKKDRSGQTILTQVKGEALKALTLAGKGSFFFGSLGGSSTQKILEDINKLEKTEFKSDKAIDYEERFQWLLLLGILLALWELFLGEKKNGKSLWKGRFEVFSHIGFYLFIAGGGTLFFRIPSEAQSSMSAQEPPALQSPKRGALSREIWISPLVFESHKRSLDYLNKDLFFDSQKAFMDSLSQDPFRFEHHFNLAHFFMKKGEKEKSLQEFMAAEKYARNEDQKFEVHFNRAYLLGEAKQLEAAVAEYQKALSIRPSSIEVRQNLELLLPPPKTSSKESGDSQDNKEGSDKGDSEGKKGDSKNSEKKGDSSGKKEPQSKEEGKDSESDKKDQNKEENKEENKKSEYQKNKPYAPRPFKGDQLSEQDVKQILGELKQQEQKIRREFHQRDSRETPNEKDW